MDIFNKKKVAALEQSLKMSQSELEVAQNELLDLQKNVLLMYDDLTAYFKSRYLNKYYEIRFDENIKRIHCIDISYEAGLINVYYTTNESQDSDDVQHFVIEPIELNMMVLISKKMFKEGK